MYIMYEIIKGLCRIFSGHPKKITGGIFTLVKITYTSFD